MDGGLPRRIERFGSFAAAAIPTSGANWSGLRPDSLPVVAQVTGKQLGAEFEALVQCRAVLADEEWAQRIWPDSNPTPKPTRRESLPDTEIRRQLDDLLRKETALRALYGVEVDAKALQTEMNRIAVGTRAPERLREQYRLLRNDAEGVANCLARPLLIERRLREGFAFDARWHGDLQGRAQAALTAGASSEALAASGGREQTLTLVLGDEKVARDPAAAEAGVLRLSAGEFARERARLLPDETKLHRLAQTSARPPRGLRETAEAFVEETVLSQAEDRLVVRSRVWAKQPFEAWWSARRSGHAPMSAWKRLGELRLPAIQGQAIPAEKAAADTWKSFVIPSERSLHTAVWTGSEMIVWGGDSGSSMLATGGRYNPATDSWTATSVIDAPSARYHHKAVWTGSVMVIWGGFSGSSNLATGGRYNPATNSWTATTTTDAPSARVHHTAVWTGSEMIIWGGYGGFVLADGGRYDPIADSWTATTTAGAPNARRQHTAVWTGSAMIVWGGYGGSILNTGGRYDPTANSWTATSTTDVPGARLGHTAVWTGSEMIIWGGSAGARLNTGGRYNPSTDSWAVTSTTDAPSIRDVHTAVWTGSEMIVWGGFSGSTNLATGGRYNPGADSWMATTTTGAPSARVSHTAVWTGSEMIVWGGVGGSVLANGSRYDRATDSWTTTGAPDARYAHTAVWTGSEMIVWGGRASGLLAVATGGRYNPAIDSWTPTSPTAAPIARWGHAAVWTGSEMIVWGGYTGSFLNTGGRYNPSTDSWVPTSPTGAPSAREAHSAVWAGSAMIIWGGYDGSVLVNGSRYDPAEDSWTATSPTGAPSARYHHKAVWTGSAMIVWGGYSGSSTLATGGRYNLMADSWTPTSSTGAPGARYVHTAVWTGSEMIVWGGWGGSSLSTGGRYNPSADSWTTTSTTGAPIGRYQHTAVWTGNAMIIWGGTDGSNLNFGGRYNPTTDSWTPTSTTGAPSARYDHTAVWTGSEMVVFGGGCTFGDLGIYYPNDTAEPSNTAIAADLPDPSVVGQAVPINVTVTGNTTQPTAGTVTITASTGETCNDPTPSAGGGNTAQYTCSIIFNTVGIRSLTAAYGGASLHLASSSTAETHAVVPAATVISINRDVLDPSPRGAPAYVGFALSVVAPGAGTPVGTVTITDGIDACTATLPATGCALNLTTLGPRTLTAQYAGSAAFQASTSLTEAHAVQSQGVIFGTSSTYGIWRMNTDGSGLGLLPAVSAPLGVAVDPQRGLLYWTGVDGAVRQSYLDGSTPSLVVNTGSSLTHGIALGDDNYIYFTRRSSNSVMRVLRDGTGLQTIVTGLSDPQSLAIDINAGKIYFASSSAGSVIRSNLDGSNQETLFSSGGPAVNGVSVYPEADSVYWSQYIGSGTLRRGARAGGAQQTLVAGPLQFPFASALDTVSGRIYWSELGDGQIRSADLVDGSDELLVQTVTPPIGNGAEGLALIPAALDASTTAISADLPDPSVVGQAVPIEISVTGGTTRPTAGAVSITSSTGESCNDTTPSAGSGNTALYACSITFNAAGNRNLTAAYGGSPQHQASLSAAEPHEVAGLPTLSISDVSQAEGNSGNTAFEFTITRSHNLNAVSAQVDTANGTAMAGSDYSALSAVPVSFTAGGALSSTVTVNVSGDSVLEAAETFFVNLSNPSGATLADGQGLGTIQNDDAASLAISSVSQPEGNATNTAFQFTATLTGAVQGGFTVPVSSADGTATAGSDYTAIAGGTNLTFAGTAGETQLIIVQVTGDTILEANESFSVTLGTPSNTAITLITASGTGAIENDDFASLAISGVSMPEGNAGNTAFQFAATLTGAVQGGFSVPVSSSDGSASAGSDYTAIAGGTNLTFVGAAGETQSIIVQVTGDAILEANESFSVTLGTPSNTAIALITASGTGTIENDDAASLAINDVTLAEGNSGTTNFQFTVTLTGATQGGFSVPFTTADGSATAPGDYASSSATLNFAGSVGETQTITIVVVGDAMVEPNEGFGVGLGTPSNAAVTLADASGAAVINNDDSTTISINDVTQAEGNSGTSPFMFTVTLAGAVQGGVSVPFVTADGSAAAPGDYTSHSGTLNFTGAAGETQSVTVAVVGDSDYEGNESFAVNLGAPSSMSVSLADATGEATIQNDDRAALNIHADASPGPSRFGQPITVSVELSVPQGAPQPTGSISVSGPSGGACAITLPALSCVLTPGVLGPQTLDFTYAGDSNIAPASTSLNHITLRFADLSISKDDGRILANAGEVLHYLIIVRNDGPDTAVGIQVDDLISASLTNATWTCSGTACAAASGSGSIQQILTLPASAEVTYALNATVISPTPALIENTAQVLAGSGSPSFLFDPDTADQIAIDVNFGDSLFRNGFEAP